MREKYKQLTEKKIIALANDRMCNIRDIMQWYQEAEGIIERTDMVKLMKARIQVCIDKKNIF